MDMRLGLGLGLEVGLVSDLLFIADGHEVRVKVRVRVRVSL